MPAARRIRQADLARPLGAHPLQYLAFDPRVAAPLRHQHPVHHHAVAVRALAVRPAGAVPLPDALSWLFAIAMEPAIGGSRPEACGAAWQPASSVWLVLLVTVLLGVVFGNLFFQQLASLVATLPDVVANVVSWLNTTFNLKLDAALIAVRAAARPPTSGHDRLPARGRGPRTRDLAAHGAARVFTFIVFGCTSPPTGHGSARAIGAWLPPSRQEVS
jgi:hypothetical protein